MAWSTGQFRLLATNATAASQVLTAGRTTLAAIAAALGVADVGSLPIISMGRSRDSERKTIAEITPIGTGADNATASFYLWQMKRGRSNQAVLLPEDVELALLGTLSVTYSTSVGAAASGAAVLSSERIADTLTWTPATDATSPKGIGDVLERIYGSPTGEAWPSGSVAAGNIPARMFLSESGNGDVLIEMVKGTCTSCNAVVEAGI